MVIKTKKHKLEINIYKYFKRIADFSFAILLIAFMSPLLITLSFLVFLNFGYPFLFSQKRIGFNNQIFTIYKFKTMKEIYDKNGKIADDSLRITKFGNLLRNSSLDELPELINIILGEMSFVGPRPFISQYLKYYNKNELRRHNVKPGITGLAQIKGRNLLSWEEKFEFDVFYVDNYNFLMDLIIIIKTILKVFYGEGVSGKNQTTIKAFKREKKDKKINDK